MSRIAPKGSEVEIHLSSAEVAILSRLPALLGSIGADAADPAVRRLHPHAYRDDDDGSLELIRLTKDDLASSRAVDVELFGRQLAASADGVDLCAHDAEAWLRVLGAARIVLASRRGLFEEDDVSALPNDDPDIALVNLLGAYQQAISEVLLVTMRSS